MQKKSGTKKSLLISILSLILSLTLLTGTTFAWFTDSTSTPVNTIQSGDLNLALEDTAGNDLENEVLPFLRTSKDGSLSSEDILWESGAKYQTNSFHVVNEGNLAVKYKIQLNKPEHSSTLIEVIDWSIEIGTNTYPTTLGASLKTSETEFSGHLLPGQISEPVTIFGSMKEAAGNEYQNLMLDGISVTVLAAQDTVEYDSYRHTYDENADYSSARWTQPSDPNESFVNPSNNSDLAPILYGDYYWDEDGVLYGWNENTNSVEIILPGSPDFINLDPRPGYHVIVTFVWEPNTMTYYLDDPENWHYFRVDPETKNFIYDY